MKKRMRTSASIQQRARELRQEMTPAERVLWERLRNRRLGGLKFRRQHPLGRFIVDFYCASHRLIIELDGPVHKAQRDYDAARAEYLRERGYRILRFSNEQVLNDIEGVLEVIEEVCKSEENGPCSVGGDPGRDGAGAEATDRKHDPTQ
ncbi:MAG TPA: endonuclease domain-containing protein [Thermoflexia bacterium]|nr:endonuclease domain-containing protein [Thermoflexia bacterium]